MSALSRAFAAAALFFSVSAQAATYQIDTSHTNMGFKVRHMVVSWTTGQFVDFSGTVELDDKKLDATKASVSVKAASIDTDDPKRDEHLRGPDFFDTEKFPEIKFVSKSIQKVSGDDFEVVGDLTIHGVTKTVTLAVSDLTPEIKDPWGSYRRGATVSATINRQDFGVSWSGTLDAGGAVVGDEVYIEIEVELTRPAS